MENVNLSQDPGLWLGKHSPASIRPGHMCCSPFLAQASPGVRGSPGSPRYSLRAGVCELLPRAAVCCSQSRKQPVLECIYVNVCIQFLGNA